ncbi:cytochrome-c peroxidase [Parabacteroides pacaensis]|uniref:cytochrome-c peroxidase n=1 Tax=Parabacteroides pacaensis TaxID=2086575 RepID=UPI000D0EDEAD|nr:cytochrome c peroxidase [Parabacteroides pacaensis]
MKNTEKLTFCIILIILCECCLFTACSHKSKHAHKHTQEPSLILSEEEQVGKLLFFDERLSEPPGQSCATCHTQERGFADKFSRVVSEGAVKGLFSARNSMTISYSAFVPHLYYDEEEETYVGGLFWDGRVNSLEEQAAEPFLNRVEMGMPMKKHVTDRIKAAGYYPRLVRLYGETDHVDSLYTHITTALAAYERSAEVNPFTSKFDAYKRGEAKFSHQEKRGYKLFKEKALCAECHILDKDPQAHRILFTDHTYDNLGIPANYESPFFTLSPEYNPAGRDSVDLGLGCTVRDPEHNGKFRVPTLRNIELTAPYGHNGYFKTLEDIVHFYNVRDVSNEYPPAEYPATVNKEELGNLKLTPEEEADLVAFLKTLTDGYTTTPK